MTAVGTQADAPSAATVAPAEQRRLLGMTWAHLLNDGASNYLPGVLPAVLISFDQPVSMAGVLIAALMVGQTLQPWLGWLADRIGGRSMIVAGLLISSLGGGLLGFAHSMPVLVLLLLLIGLGNAMFHPPALAGVRTLMHGRQGFLTAVFLVGGELGRGIWPTAASLVVVNLGLSYLWIVCLPGLLTVPLLYRIAPKLPSRPQRSPRIRWLEHTVPMTVLMTYACTRALAISALVTFVPILWHIQGGSLVAGASIITTMLVVGVIGNLGGGHLTDRLGRVPVLVASALATAACIALLASVHGAMEWVIAAPLGIAIFMTMPTTILLGQDIFPENRSMGSGIALGLANGIGALLVLLIGLWVSDNGVTTVLWIVAALSAASALAVLALPPDLKRHHLVAR